MDQPVKTLATGYGLIEGPRVDDDNRLYFSDVLRGGVYRREPDGDIGTVVPKRRGVGGIALHEAGGVVVSGRNICHVLDGETRILFESPDTPSFNDIFTDADGRVLAGSLRYSPFHGDGERPPGELYRIEAEGRATRLYEDVEMSNGIGLSPDARRLYHNDTSRNQVLVHDVAADGSCHDRRVFARLERGIPDGLAVDEDGGVWIAAYQGGCVTRYTASGELDRHLEVPARVVTSVCLGGPERRDLYVVSADNTDDPALGGCIFRTEVEVPGVAAALVRI